MSLDLTISHMLADMAAWHAAESARKQRVDNDRFVQFLRAEAEANETGTISNGREFIGSLNTSRRVRRARCSLLLSSRIAKVGSGVSYTARLNLETAAEFRRMECDLRKIEAGDALLDRTLAALQHKAA